MRYPVNYIYISQSFKNKGLFKHYGLDLGWSSKHLGANQSVYAIDDGKVIYNRYQRSGGYVIHIKHSNGTVSEYGHLLKDSQLVHEGDYVKRGQKIAKMGRSGRVTGNHLHLGIYKGSKIDYSKKYNFIDPLEYLCVFDKQEVSDKTLSKYKLNFTRIVTGVPDEPLLVRDKYGKRVVSRDLYNGDETSVYNIISSKKIVVDKLKGYTTYKKYLK